MLLPLALAQGVLVRVRTPRLPPAEGESGHVGHSTDPLRVVGVGDSIIAGVGCTTQDEALIGQLARVLSRRTGRAVHWHAIGRNGAASRDVVEELAPRAPPADLYVLSTVVNDTIRGTRVADFAARLAAMLAVLWARTPQAAVVFAGTPPFEAFPSLPRPLSEVLARRAALLHAAAHTQSRSTPAFSCFDLPPHAPADMFSADGFHPGPAGCTVWAEWLAEFVLNRPPPARSAVPQLDAANCSR